MSTISFKQFIAVCKEYYDIKQGEYFRIENERDMDEVICEIYDKENTQYEIDYENKIIELY